MARTLPFLALALLAVLCAYRLCAPVPPPSSAVGAQAGDGAVEVELPSTLESLADPAPDRSRAAPDAPARTTPARTTPTDSRTVHAPADAPLLVGRLALEHGGPFAGRAVQLSITRADGSPARSQPVETDADGRFEFPVSNVADPLEDLGLGVRERAESARLLTASVALPPLARGGVTDVGDIVLVPRTVGVTCRVVLRDGQPFSAPGELGPEVELWGAAGERKHDDRRSRGDTVLLRFDGDVREGWLTLEQRGSSAFEHPVFVDPLQAGARARAVGGWTGVAVRAGDEVELVVARGGTIHGSVRRDSPGSAGIDRVRVRSIHDTAELARGGTAREQAAWGTIAEDGSFVVEGVDAGVRRVEFVMEHMAMHSIDGVEVRLEQDVHDARLQAVDLDHITPSITLVVVDLAGVAIPGARATLVASDSVQRFEAANGVVSVPLPAPTADDAPQLFAHAAGFAPAVVRGPLRSMTVTLEPALEIRARTVASVRRDTGSHGFWLRLRSASSPKSAAWLWSAELPFKWDGLEPKELVLPGAGRYELEVMVKRRWGSRFGTTPSDRYVGTGVFVDVGPEHASSPLQIDVPQDLERFDTR